MVIGRFRIVGVACGTAVALAGCAGSQPSATTTPIDTTTPIGWKEPPRYAYTLDSRCGEQLLIGRFRITVADGRTTAATGLDESATRVVRNAGLERLPTLGALLSQAANARAKGAAEAEVEFAADGRYPARISIDRDANSIDDELCYVISDFTAPPRS